MLKIKSNTDEFTIIFSKKIGKKKNAQKISFSLCSVQHPFFFSPSFLLVSASFLFFLLLFQRPSLFLLCASFFSFSSCLSFLFSSRVPFFSAQKHSFQPKTILSLTQKHFFQPKRFCFSLATLLFFFFSALFFFGSALFFLFQRLLFFFSLAPFIQGPIFSLVASHLFYLNKSLFSSNLK